MHVTPDKTASFMPISDILTNPYIGFVSFQHFRGEKCFSPATEGWMKEFYPLYPGAVEEEGWHPDTTVAYIRICWKDFEPEDGVYDFAFTDRIFESSKAHGQTLMMRLMPHTTRCEQDIPAWLAEKIPHPERPVDARVKDSPADPLFYSRFARAVRVFGARYDEDPVLSAMDVSLCGAWGEGHNFDFLPEESVQMLADAFLDAFQRTPLIGQICSPTLINRMRKKRPVGYRCDCLGDMNHHMIRYYPRSIARMNDAWMTAPVAFESCWVMNHWLEMGWDIDYIIEQSLKWHISTFNAKYTSCPTEWEPQIQKWLLRMGYRFAPRLIEFPSVFRAGDLATFGMWMENRGVAPLYNRIPFSLRFRSESGQNDVILETGLDALKWLPGDSFETFTVGIPAEIRPGRYRLQLGLSDREKSTPAVALASDMEKDGRFYTVSSVDVQE